MPQPLVASIPTPQHIKFDSLSDGATESFSFKFQPELIMVLTFPPQASPPKPMKRCRSVSDVDGEHSCLPKKKRRLRLFLVTSRLSPQFSNPATNIVDRGNSKIAVWAKQKAMGRNLLYKAAILNNLRCRVTRAATPDENGLGKMIVSQDRTKEQFRLADLTLKYGSHQSLTKAGLPLPPSLNHDGNFINNRNSLSRSPSRSQSSSGSSSPELLPRDHDSSAEYSSPNDAYFDSSTSSRSRTMCRSYLPLPPSPLGLSNYDAFDQEDDASDPYAYLDEYDAEHRDIDDDGTDALFYSSTERHNMPTSPVHSIYSDFSILDPEEPVFGDYDRVDEGANPIWPTHPGSDQSSSASIPLSSSPNFSSLFATTTTITTTTAVEQAPRSPSLTPRVSTAVSPNFPSPFVPPLDVVTTPTAVSISPILAALHPVVNETIPESKIYELDTLKRERESEMEEERQRQKKLMFARFGL